MRDILSKGGDVHANAAIVGGLLGAALGSDGIGTSRVEKVLIYLENGVELHSQPELASSKHLSLQSQFEKLFRTCPKKLKVVWSDMQLDGFQSVKKHFEKTLQQPF